MPMDGPPEAAKDLMTDDEGNFAFSALRPGTYKAVAWECRMDPLAIATAALVFERTARTVTVSVWLAPPGPKKVPGKEQL